MFPLRDDNPTLHKSIITFIIISMNVLVWVLVEGMGANPWITRAVCQFGLVPGELLQTLPAGMRIPLAQNSLCTIGESPDWFSLVSHMFLHGGWFHLIGNLWFLYVFGDNVEDAMGRIRFIFFYLLCGLAAAGVQLLANPTSPVPMVGASGAISGVMGAYAVLYPQAAVHVLIFLGFFIQRIILPAYLMLGYWFLLQLVGAVPSISGSSGVAFFAHIGGFIAGVILIFLFRNKERVEIQRELLRRRRWGS